MDVSTTSLSRECPLYVRFGDVKTQEASPEMRWKRGMTADAASLHSLNSPIFLGRSPARTDLNHVGLNGAICRYAGEINKLQYTHFHIRDFPVHFVRHLRGRWVWSRMRSRGPAGLGGRKTRFSGNSMEPLRRSGTLPPSTFTWCSSAIAMPRRDMSHQRTNVCLWISPPTQRLQTEVDTAASLVGADAAPDKSSRAGGGGDSGGSIMAPERRRTRRLWSLRASCQIPGWQ